jgi:hypothetical protein
MEYLERKWAYYNRRRPSSYVQDGLVLWLDGIDNTRNGHDPNATEWEDLSGNGFDFAPKVSENCPTVGDKYITGFDSDTCLVSQDDGLNAYANMNTAGTLECVYMITSHSTDTMQVFGFRNGVGADSLQSKICVPHAGGLIIGGRQTSSTNARWRFDSFMTNEDINRILHVSIEYTGTSNLANGYVDGNAIVGLNPQDTGWGNAGGNCIGDRLHTSSTTSYYMKGRIYCIRYYDRILTDAEREHNRQTDIRRFGA